MNHRGNDRKKHDVAAELGQGLKSVHNCGVHDFKVDLKSWSRIFMLIFLLFLLAGK